MRPSRKKTFSRPFKLVLVVCGLAGVALLWFSGQVASLDDSPNGPVPPASGFKAQVKQVAAFFKTADSVNNSTKVSKPQPRIDLAHPQETATALFALG